jgi:hypothetical protein
MDDLKPCRACGAPCRIERFSGEHIEGVLTAYFCSNATKFGGDCPDPHAYLNVNAWNFRTPDTDDSISKVGLREKIVEILRESIGETGDDYWGHEITGIDEAADLILDHLLPNAGTSVPTDPLAARSKSG